MGQRTTEIHRRWFVGCAATALLAAGSCDSAGVDPVPETGLSIAPGVTLDARLLVITADGQSASAAAITSALDFLGSPYDVLDAGAGTDLTPDVLAAGDHGRYDGIVLETGDLAAGSTSALSADEWMTLASYEARFGVRRAVMYARPDAAYGLSIVGERETEAAPVAARCTAAGKSVFIGTNCEGPVAIDEGHAYRGQPTDADTVPLLVDDDGGVYAATRSYGDGREALVMTFAQSPAALHTLALIQGVISWVTHGLFIGEHRVYASAQIDDFYLATAIYTGGAYRITGDDLAAFGDWQSARRARPVTAQFRATLAFNAFGAKATDQDSLSDEAQELASSFIWMNHTWAHHVMTSMSYAQATEAVLQNVQWAMGVGLPSFSREDLVTPEISGLDNPEAMRAAFDAGVRQLVSDTSVAGQDNPSVNAGYWLPTNPGILAIPRRPSGLSFNVGLPEEWIAKYGDVHKGQFSYEQIIDACSDDLASELLRGNYDPWMFHQLNVRDYGGRRSLLSDLLDATFDKYAARATFPVVSPTMGELAQKVKERMALDASGVSATIGPGATITVQVTNAATIPVTGLCTPAADSDGSHPISYLTLGAGESVTLPLDQCPGGTGSGGQGGLSTKVGTISAKAADADGCSVAGDRAPGGGGGLVLVLAAGALLRRSRLLRGSSRRTWSARDRPTSASRWRR